MKGYRAFIFSGCLLFFVLPTAGAQTFFQAVDHFFTTSDISQAKQFIGKVVSNEDMRNVERKYPGTGLRIARSKPRLGISVHTLPSKVILYSLTSKLSEGKNVYEIWDVQSLELDPGSTVYPMRLMKQSIDFPNGNQEIEEAIGLLVLKEGERVPEEKRIVPDWILTADSEGKILLSKPTDRLRYVFMPGGPM